MSGRPFVPEYQKMVKYIALSLALYLLSSCRNGSATRAAAYGEEDYMAKEMLQGIWLEEETEAPVMRVEGDTVYYVDARTMPVAFKVVRDTFYTYGNDTSFYKIDKQTEHIFWFHSVTDDVVKLYKSDDPNDSLSFVRQSWDVPIYTEVTKRDSVVTYNGTRYRAYVYINPSTKKVVKTTYSEEGIGMENVYYDNIMHICVYEGKKSLFASDVTKQMFSEVLPKEILEHTILSDIQFKKVNRNGFYYQAVLAIPESSVSSVAELIIDFDGRLTIATTQYPH